MQDSYQRIITRTRKVGSFVYRDEPVEGVRSCEFEIRRSGGRTWARLDVAREFRESAEFNRMDEYRICFAPDDVRFVGYLVGVHRQSPGGVFQLTLFSPVMRLEQIRPIFPKLPSEHPAQADVSHWVRTLLAECLAGQEMLECDLEGIPDSGTLIEMPILDGAWSLFTVLDVLAVMAGFWSWGVDLNNKIYFVPVESWTQAQFHVGADRGWGKVVSVTEQSSLHEIVNSVRLYGEIPASLNGEGKVVYPESPAVFSATFSSLISQARFGINHRTLSVPLVRAEKQAAAVAQACLARTGIPEPHYQLNISNVLRSLDPAQGLLLLYDEVGERLGAYPAEQIIFHLGEDARAIVEMGCPKMGVSPHPMEPESKPRTFADGTSNLWNALGTRLVL